MLIASPQIPSVVHNSPTRYLGHINLFDLRLVPWHYNVTLHFDLETNCASPKKQASVDESSVDLKEVVKVLNGVYGVSQNIDKEESTFPLQQKLLLCSLMLILNKGRNKDVTISKVNIVLFPCMTFAFYVLPSYSPSPVTFTLFMNSQIHFHCFFPSHPSHNLYLCLSHSSNDIFYMKFDAQKLVHPFLHTSPSPFCLQFTFLQFIPNYVRVNISPSL